MSRSYKKIPITKDGGKSSKIEKRLANKKVRRNIYDIPNKGKAYKKIYNSWNIDDYISYYSKKEAICDWYEETTYALLRNCPLDEYGNHKIYGTLENYLNNYWKKYNMRK